MILQSVPTHNISKGLTAAPFGYGSSTCDPRPFSLPFLSFFFSFLFFLFTHIHHTHIHNAHTHTAARDSLCIPAASCSKLGASACTAIFPCTSIRLLSHIMAQGSLSFPAASVLSARRGDSASSLSLLSHVRWSLRWHLHSGVYFFASLLYAPLEPARLWRSVLVAGQAQVALSFLFSLVCVCRRKGSPYRGRTPPKQKSKAPRQVPPSFRGSGGVETLSRLSPSRGRPLAGWLGG